MGERPTRFEVDLLARTESDSAWVVLAQRLMETLGAEQGAAVFCLVLDEIGGAGGKVSIPSRRGLISRLWRCERDELIRSLATRPDWTPADIASALGTTPDVVRQRLHRDTRARASRRREVRQGT